MADGARLDIPGGVNKFAGRNGYSEMFTALDAAAAAGNGVWIRVAGCRNLGVQVSGISGDTVKITGYITDDGVAPANSEHGTELVSVTADGLYFPLDAMEMVEWLKVRCSDRSAGTIDANVIVTY